MSTEHQDLAERVRDAVAEVVAGTPWLPEGKVLVDCVVVLGTVDPQGEWGRSHLRCGSPWATHGLMLDALDAIEQLQSAENAPVEEEP